MTLQQIRYFIAVAECGSISAAAKKLFISQSSISEAIKEIESTYGITAFNRHSRGIQLTRDGDELLVEKIKQVSNYPCKTGHFAAFLLD